MKKEAKKVVIFTWTLRVLSYSLREKIFSNSSDLKHGYVIEKIAWPLTPKFVLLFLMHKYIFKKAKYKKYKKRHKMEQKISSQMN